MIVVSDTSPLNYLVLINAVELLPRLFGQVYTPPEVIAELLHARTPEAVRKWAQRPPAWLKVVCSTQRIEAPAKLGPGEVSAISLAKQLGADWLLIDERDGTRFAAEQGLRIIGTLAVLEEAAARNLLDLPGALKQLEQTSFRLSAPLIQAALDRHKARRANP